MASQACDANSLSALARCGDCLPEGYKPLVIIALLAQIAGVPVNANSLAAMGNCFACLSPSEKGQVMIALLCQIVNGGGSGPPPVTCSDSDANAFLTAAGISDTTTVNAVCTLVTSLKSAGVWTLMDAIYPMVGGTSSSTSYNLKNPATFRITWTGGVTFAANGVTGDGATGYGNTNFTASTAGGNYGVNSCCIGVDFFATPPLTGFVMGATSSAQPDSLIRTPGTAVQVIGPHANVGTSSTGYYGTGLYLASRVSSTEVDFYWATGSTQNMSDTVAVGVPDVAYFILAHNANGTPSTFDAASLSMAVVGGGLNSTQAAALRTAVTAFQTSLSRN